MQGPLPAGQPRPFGRGLAADRAHPTYLGSYLLAGEGRKLGWGGRSGGKADPEAEDWAVDNGGMSCGQLGVLDVHAARRPAAFHLPRP